MPGRYQIRLVAINSDELYKGIFKNRGVSFIKQFKTPELKYPSPEEIGKLDEISHIWTLGDRFYKLAYEYYGDPELWWVIAAINQTPTENHVTVGQNIYIWYPLDEVISLLGY